MKYRLVLFLLMLISLQTIKAQLTADISMLGGANYASSGLYSDFSGGITAVISEWQFAATAGVTFSNARENEFNALKMDVSRDFRIKEKPVTGHIFYQWHPFSAILQEHNAGIIFHHRSNKFSYDIGLNTRIFKLPNAYAESNGYDQVSIWEPINLMYKITYYHPFSDQWDFKASVTNFDTFLIQQETNPMLIANLGYQLSSKLKMYLDLGYLQAGLMNIRVNYFGYFIRGGIQWEL
ncbi:MAG: hypothetical protein PHG64_04810 [Paludibacter sp.]|nr:hypothetical protein [Paludibacter sp.]